MADELETRVLACFSNVFPGIGAAELRRASQDSRPDWDSVMHVTLLVSLAEEFQFEIDFDVAAELSSFDLIVDYLRNRHNDG